MDTPVKAFASLVTGAALGLAMLLGAVLYFDGGRIRDKVSMPAPEEDQRAVLECIRSFNAIWSDFYATGGIPSMIDAMPASKAVKHGIFRDIGLLADQGKLLVYDQARMVPGRVDFPSADRAEVMVFEEWNYVYQDAASRAPLTKVMGMGQGFRYRLAREGGRWRIEEWDPVDMQAPEKEGFVW